MPRSDSQALERQARRRLSRVTPENAGKVVSLDIYWTVPFLENFLEKCDAVAFERPADAQKLAFYAPSLADLIGVGCRAGEYLNESEKRSFRARARGVFGSTCYRVGELEDASVAYSNAVGLIQGGSVDPFAKADVLMRLGNFKTNINEYGDPEGFDLLSEAIEIFARLDSPSLALAFVLRGTWYWLAKQPKEAATEYSKALSAAAHDLSLPVSHRASIAALGNLSRLLAEHQLFAMDHDHVLALIHQARRRLASRRLSVVKAKLFWVEATLNQKLHFEPRALRLLEKARDSFFELQMPEEFILTSLEIAMIYRDSSDTLKLESLRRETLARLPKIAPDPTLLATVKHWSGEISRDDLILIHQAASTSRVA